GSCAVSSSHSYHMEYEADDVLVRYEARNERVILVSWHTGAVIRENATTLIARSVDKFSWSSTCHYLLGVVDNEAVIWDMLNGGRVNAFTIEPAVYRTQWNPARENLILHGEKTAYLWNF